MEEINPAFAVCYCPSSIDPGLPYECCLLSIHYLSG
jgi:hypothetical protein